MKPAYPVGRPTTAHPHPSDCPLTFLYFVSFYSTYPLLTNHKTYCTYCLLPPVPPQPSFPLACSHGRRYPADISKVRKQSLAHTRYSFLNICWKNEIEGYMKLGGLPFFQLPLSPNLSQSHWLKTPLDRPAAVIKANYATSCSSLDFGAIFFKEGNFQWCYTLHPYYHYALTSMAILLHSERTLVKGAMGI